MKRLWLAISALAIVLCTSPADSLLQRGSNGVIVTLTPGVFIPTAQTPLMPSASVWPPSCAANPTNAAENAAWGVGCTTATGLCAAPTTGTPLETCQPPAELVVTGGTGNGTNSTIDYTSYAHYNYPTGMQLVISGATQANWNTPRIGINSYTQSGSSPNFLVTLGCETTTTGFPGGGTGIPPQKNWGLTCANLVPGNTMYVGQTSVDNENFTCKVTSTCGTTTNHAAVERYINLPVTTTSGSGTGGTVNLLTNNVGTITQVTWANRGTGYADGDTITGLDISGAPYLGTLTGFSTTVQNYTLPTINQPWVVAGSPNAPTTSTVTVNTGSHQLVGTYGGLNVVGFNGAIQQPWVVSSSVCGISGVPEHCSVTFLNPYSCASSCVSASTQIVAGQNDDIVLSWHYGEDVPYSLQNSDARACVLAQHISGVQYVSFSLDGGPWSKVSSSIVDPWGPGKSGLDTSKVKVYCAHFNPSSVADGLHEIRAAGCPVVGNCAIMSSVMAADATSGSTYLALHTHGYQGFKLVGITNSPDAGTGSTTGGGFQNYDWRYYTPSNITTLSGAAGGTSAGTGTSGETFTLNFTQPTAYPAFTVGQTVSVGATSNEACTATSASSNGTTLIVGFTASPTNCNFPAGAEVTLTGFTPSTGNAWNSIANLPVPVVSSTSTSITLAACCSTATASALGVIHANWTGPCTITAAASGTITCPQPFNTATALSGTATISAQGNLMCIVGGSGDFPAPYDPVGFDQTDRGQLFPDAFQLIPATASNCSNAENNTGCSTLFSCGTLPTPPTGTQETLWLTRKDAGLDERNPTVRASSYENLNGSDWINTNAQGTKKKRDAYVDSWKQTVHSGSCLGAIAASGATLVGFTGDYCTSLHDAFFAMIPTANNQTQTLSGGSGSCILFTNTAQGNATGATPFYIGEPVEPNGILDQTASGVDGNGNATPSLSNFGVYYIVNMSGTGNNSISLATTPGGLCLDEALSSVTVPGPAKLTVDLGQNSILLACDTAVTTPCANSNPETFVNLFLRGDLNGSLQGTAKSGWLSIAPDTAATSTFPATQTNVSLAEGSGGWFGTTISEGGRLRIAVDTIQTPLSLAPAVALTKTPPITTVTGGNLVANGAALPGGATCVSSTVCETLTFSTLSGTGAAWQVPTSTGGVGQSVAATGILSTGGSWLCGATTTFTVSSSCHILDATSTSVSFAQTYSYTTFAGTGAVSTTYTNIPITITSGSGTGGTVNVTTNASGVVTNVVRNVAGSGYANGDTISGSSGSLTAYSATVATASGSWASGGTQKIFPGTIVLEFPGGTFAYDGPSGGNTNPNGLCSTTGGLSINTGSAKSCLSTSTVSAVNRAFGTNSTAWPWQSGVGAVVIGQSSNCFPILAGQQVQSENATGVVTQTQTGANLPFIPAQFSGLTNDVVELAWGSAGAFSFQLFNNCSGNVVFDAFGFTLLGQTLFNGTDTWADGRDVIGGTWRNPGNNDTRTGITGAAIVTNYSTLNTPTGADSASYVWGAMIKYNGGVCGNGNVTMVDINCIGGANSVPTAAPYFGANQDGVPLGAFWLSLTANVTSGDTTFHVAPGTLPGNTQEGHFVDIDCNATVLPNINVTNNAGPSQSNVLFESTLISYDNVAGTFTTNSGAFASCPVSSNPIVTWYNINHIDAFFYSSNTSIVPLSSGFPWIAVSNSFYENAVCTYCVQMQQLFVAGMKYYNVVYDNDSFEVMHEPLNNNASDTERALQMGGYSNYNYTISNSNMFGPTDILLSTGDLDDVYILNDNAGLSPLYPNIPLSQPLQGGGIVQLSTVPPPADVQTNGSSQPQLNIWPTASVTFSSTGLPNADGKPGPANLGMLPWYYPAEDAGNGTN